MSTTSAPSNASAGRATPTGGPSIAIVGAGFGGIGMAIRLKQAGFGDLAIFDRAAGVGGVWRDNTYPGAACDVPSPLYSYSFAPNQEWPNRYSEQPAILDYIESCVDRFGLRPHLRLNATVERVAFDETVGRWRLEVDGRVHEADVLIPACGQLSEPAYPSIEGIERFTGEAFHSARWDHDVDLRGKRVAVVGSGASAIQFVPRIAPDVEQLTVYQRSAPYIIPRMQTAYTARHHRIFRMLPWIQRAERFGWFAFGEIGTAGMVKGEWITAPFKQLALAYLKRKVADPELRRILTPNYAFGCKRVLFSENYYDAMVRPNVEVIPRSVREVTATGLVDADGVERPADAIIYGTGFRTKDFVAPMEVRGLGGRELNEAWASGERAHLGVTVSGFPNMFLTYGPNTNLGAGSIIYMIESQANYVIDALQRLSARGGGYLDVREEALDAFDREVQTRLSGTVWQTGCHSWYVDEHGRNANNWPAQVVEYRRRTRQIDPDDYRFVAPNPGPAAAERALAGATGD
ncbi:flavin-containing monooxygenase [Patulibacter defluvii]|uniref:flavin-containing monooxygenase n=1 Tax=Patulibacter defluvii TaxID=3095358 RepID=UPI002A757223|nr:NAD(P)/FAD-dependent oxidoreductase [Patulibacter sp. DM4]